MAHYKLTSTIMLHLVSTGSVNDKSNSTTGTVDLSGSMTRQVELDSSLTDSSSHITNTGRMIEDQEIKMRNLLQEVYFGKTKDVVHDLRSVDSLEKARKQREVQKELAGLLRK